MTRKREIVIQTHEIGKNLINWISARYTYHTKDEWENLILSGNVLVNSNFSDPNYILCNNDIVMYTPKEVVEPPVNNDYKIIYEDLDLLVINKPCDLPCHPGGIYFQNTLWYLLKQKYEYFALINRLDRETSGVMLIAKNKESAKFYFNTMMERKITKEYLVIVHGVLEKSIDAKGWLIKDEDSIIRKKRKFILDPESKNSTDKFSPPDDKQFSHTIIDPIKSKDDLSLLHCNLITGKTHQIRATLYSLGYPVLGDKIYGLNEGYFFDFINDELTPGDWEKLSLKNQALHSYRTTLPLISGENKTFIADPPDNWPINNCYNNL